MTMLKKLFIHNIGGDVRCVVVLSRFLTTLARFIEKRSRHRSALQYRQQYGALDWSTSTRFSTSTSLCADFAHLDNCQDTLNTPGSRQSFQHCSIICKVQ